MAEEEREAKWNTLRVRGLRQRWIVNSIMPVLVLLALLVTLFSAGISSYYYGTMKDGMEKQARAEAGAFNDYFMDNGYTEYLQRAAQSTANFADKERIELQFVNSAGRIQVSSTSSLKNGIKPGTDEITRAMAQKECAVFQGRDPETGENIMAVSAPLVYSGKVVGVLRLVTSLRQVNRQILIAIAVIFVVAALCMTMVIIANLLFHQQCGGAGGGGHGRRQAHFRRELRHSDRKQIHRRAGRTGGQYQRHVLENRS